MSRLESKIPHPWWHFIHTMRGECSVTEDGVPYSDFHCEKCQKIYRVHEAVVNYERVNIYENSKGK